MSRDVILARRKREQQFEQEHDTFQAVLVGVDYTSSPNVARQPGFVWFQELIPGDPSPGIAFNRKVPALVGLRVTVKRWPKRPFDYEVIDWDPDQVKNLASFSGTPLLVQHGRDHEPGGYDPINVYQEMLVPLRTDPGGGLTVDVALYRYTLNGSSVVFGGHNGYSLAGQVPASGLARVVLVYLDTATNALAIVAGDTTVDLDTVRPTKPDVPSGGIASSYVRLAGGQTEIERTDIEPAREWLNQVEKSHNFNATSDPTVNDDSSDGYAIGSMWVNTSTDTIWVCADATVGAAVWRQIDIDDFLSMSDTPSSYSGQANKVVAVNTGETALEFITNSDTFLSMSDTPSSYSGQANKVVAVNTGETALEFVDGGGGGLPGPAQVFVHDDSAGAIVEESTIANAFTTADPGDVVIAGVDDWAETLTLTEAIVFRGISREETTVTSLTLQAAAVIEDLGCNSSGGFAANTTGGGIWRRCKMTVSTGGASRAGWSLNVAQTLEDCEATVSGGGTANYGVAVNAAVTVTIRGGRFSGTTADLYATTGATLDLDGPELANGTISGTWTGWWKDAAGNIYQSDGEDIFPDDDDSGLFNRFVNFGFTPDEHWRDGTEVISWTGWAAYTGFATPSSTSIADSVYTVAHNASAKAFRYRSVPGSTPVIARARAKVTEICGVGLMLDDGSNTGDGNGADNFVRGYLYQASAGAVINAIVQYRTGGGGVTTATSTFQLDWDEFHGIQLLTTGTFWTNWSASGAIVGEGGAQQAFASVSGLSFTPTRIGLYFVLGGGFNPTNRKALLDWYKESTS